MRRELRLDKVCRVCSIEIYRPHLYGKIFDSEKGLLYLINLKSHGVSKCKVDIHKKCWNIITENSTIPALSWKVPPKHPFITASIYPKYTFKKDRFCCLCDEKYDKFEQDHIEIRDEDEMKSSFVCMECVRFQFGNDAEIFNFFVGLT